MSRVETARVLEAIARTREAHLNYARCATCKWWGKAGDTYRTEPSVKFCFRYPPTPTFGVAYDPDDRSYNKYDDDYRPLTAPDDYCGEHAPSA
jgi:hypothetical protein